MEKLLPHNIEAEESVLGSLIIDPEALVQVEDVLRPDDFYRDAHRMLYQAMLTLFARREPGDLVTLCNELERTNKLVLVGGAAAVVSLMNGVPTSANAVYYARIVAQKALYRRLIAVAGRMAAIAYEEADDALEEAEQLVFGLGQGQGEASALIPIQVVLSDCMTTLDALHERRTAITGVPTGYRHLDVPLGGLQHSDLVILAARPATGKTSFALNVARNACQAGSRVAFFSLEMSRQQLGMRLLSMEAGIDQHRLRIGRVEDDEWDQLVAALGILSEGQLWIDDSAAISLAALRSRARRMQANPGVDLIVVDYLQLMRATLEGKRFGNREQEIAEISRGLKAVAKELNVPVLALAQLSRAVESRASRVPQLSDLRESGCLTGDTLVYHPDEGIYKPIETLIGQSGFRVLSLNTETWKLEPRLVTHAFVTGHKQTSTMITRLGRTIRATGCHPFLTFEGWRCLEQLGPGDRIALPRRLPGPPQQTMTSAELGLLGHLIGDGCTLKRSAIQYITADLELAKIVVNLAKTVFGETIRPHITEVKRATDKRVRYYVFLSSTQRLTHGKRNPIAAWLDALGAFNLRSYDKHVPDQVFRQSASGIACFLRHLWSTDGCIHLSQSTGHYASVYYASSSYQLASHVQKLLLRLGIQAKLSLRSQGKKGRDQYHVSISGKTDLLHFLQEVGGLGENKVIHHASIVQHLSHHPENTNRDIIPHQTWHTLVVPAMRASLMSQRTMQAALGMSYCGTTLYKQNMSRERTARVAAIVQSDELEKLAKSDVYWDEIVSIAPGEVCEVYDLTVEGLHNFIASDIVVHNSIENDADVVLFIYRDDLYNPQSEAVGTADLIIAKHRNGPTGTIRLGFDPTQTRFYTLEGTSGEE